MDTISEPLTANEPSDYERLIRFVNGTQHQFALAIARYVDSRVRDRLIEQARQDALKNGVRVIVLNLNEEAPETNLIEHMRAAIANPESQPVVLFVTRLEPFLLDPLGNERITPSIGALNRARDSLPDRLPVKLVLWLSHAATNAFSTHAHDLYDVALTFFWFETKEVPKAISSYGIVPNWMIEASEKEKPQFQRELALLQTVFRNTTVPASKADTASRIAQLHVVLGNHTEAERWLSDTIELWRNLNNPIGEAGAYLKSGDFYQMQGQFDGALKNYQCAVNLYSLKINKYGLALSRGRIADILQYQGRFDDALDIRLNEEIPVYEELGDLELIAVANGRIVEILMNQKKFNEALELGKNKILPIYENLKNIRSITITKGQIADILQAQGKYDEALELRKNEQIPIYEILGDSLSSATTKGRVAEILLLQGKTNEALMLTRNEVLPVYEQLNAVREVTISRINIAKILIKRKKSGDQEEAIHLLQLALKSARQMQIPEVAQIENLLIDLGEKP